MRCTCNRQARSWLWRCSMLVRTTRPLRLHTAVCENPMRERSRSEHGTMRSSPGMKTKSTAAAGTRRTCHALDALAVPRGRSVLADSLIAIAIFFLVTGCGTVLPQAQQKNSIVMQEVMERKDRIILVSGKDLVPEHPSLLLLHGATDDPSEMLTIAGQWAATYNVFLYSYNFHHSLERLASDL